MAMIFFFKKMGLQNFCEILHRMKKDSRGESCAFSWGSWSGSWCFFLQFIQSQCSVKMIKEVGNVQAFSSDFQYLHKENIFSSFIKY